MSIYQTKTTINIILAILCVVLIFLLRFNYIKNTTASTILAILLIFYFISQFFI